MDMYIPKALRIHSNDKHGYGIRYYHRNKCFISLHWVYRSKLTTTDVNPVSSFWPKSI